MKKPDTQDKPTVLPLYTSACPAQLPSPFCCFAACVDVHGPHSNVHLRCFHTGKSTATRAAPSPRKLPVSPSVILISLILCLHFLSLPDLVVTQSLAARTDGCSLNAILSVLPESEVICSLMISVCSCSLSFKSPLSGRFVPLAVTTFGPEFTGLELKSF